MKTARLSDVCKLVNGGTPKSGVAEYWGGDVAWLTPAEMGKRTTPYLAQTARTISRIGLANCSARQVPVGAVIMSTRAPIGHLAIPETPMAFNQGCRGLIPDETLDTKYLYYFLWFSRDALNELGTGATFKELSSSALGNYRIPLPSLEEQRRIVAVLDAAFAAIATTTTNAENNLANALALPRAHLSGLLGKAENLETALIGEVAFIQEGPGIRKYEYEDGGYPMINVRCVQDGRIDMSKGRAANTKLATGKWRHFQVVEGDILFTTSGTIGRCAIVKSHNLPLLMNTSVVRFRTESKRLLQRYLYHFLRSDLFQKPLLELASGTAIANVGPTHIKTLFISIPSLGEQDRISSQLDAMIELADELRAVCELKLSALAALKQSLLHRAFTGELTAAMPETIAA